MYTCTYTCTYTYTYVRTYARTYYVRTGSRSSSLAFDWACCASCHQLTGANARPRPIKTATNSFATDPCHSLHCKRRWKRVMRRHDSIRDSLTRTLELGLVKDVRQTRRPVPT